MKKIVLEEISKYKFFNYFNWMHVILKEAQEGVHGIKKHDNRHIRTKDPARYLENAESVEARIFGSLEVKGFK